MAINSNRRNILTITVTILASLLILTSIFILIFWPSNKIPPEKPSEEKILERPLIIDYLWNESYVSSFANLTIDSSLGALTLKNNMVNFSHVVNPDPDKMAFPNSIYDLEVINDKLYLGYGDIWSNRGPVDIVSYNPLNGNLLREYNNAPEELLYSYSAGSNGRGYVSGTDARESWAFGSCYVNFGNNWIKRRTVANVSKFYDIIEFKNKLYICPATTYNLKDFYAIQSDNFGCTWYREKIADGEYGITYLDDFRKVQHVGGESLYVKGGEYNPAFTKSRRTIFKYDGNTWEELEITDPNGNFTVTYLCPCNEKLLILGRFVYDQTSENEFRCYSYDGTSLTEITFLRNTWIREEHLIANKNWVYCIIPLRITTPYLQKNILYRSQDLISWEKIGVFSLKNGAIPNSVAFWHDRLYIGTQIAGRWYIGNYEEYWGFYLFTLDNAVFYCDATVPNGAQFEVKIRSGTSYSDLGTKEYVGPDGTVNTAYNISGTPLNSTHNSDTMDQLRIYRTPNDQDEYPTINSITISNPSNATETYVMAIDEGQGLYTASSYESATYISQVFHQNNTINNGALYFDGIQPEKTKIYFQLRTANNLTELEGTAFVGPDGTTNTYYESSGTAFWTGHNNHSYIQYKAYLTTEDLTLAPYLKKVTLFMRTNVLHHINIQLPEVDPWIAGEEYSVSVTAYDQNETQLPIYGSITIMATDETNDEIPYCSTELILENGTGICTISLCQAISTKIKVQIAGMINSSQLINVRSASAEYFEITTNLTSPKENWSPEGQVGVPFSVTVTAYDRFGNIVKDYTGTIEFQIWIVEEKTQTLPSAYTFTLSDEGTHLFENGVTIDLAAEWNIVCFDSITQSIAGSLTIKIIT